MNEKNKGGRPKENLSSLPEGWEEDILNLYREGASNVEVKAWIHEQRGSFSGDLWNRWMLEEEKFSTTIKKGIELANAWWERMGRKNLANKDFSSTLWYMNMKNRYGWRDKQEIDVTSKAEIKQANINYSDMSEEEKSNLFKEMINGD